MTPLWEGLTLYAVGAQVVNAGGLYQCTVAGQAAATGGPTGTNSDIVDGTVHWSYVKRAWGLMPQGWVGKPLDQIKSDIEARLKAGPLGESAGTEADGSIPVGSVAGQLVAIMTDALAEAWDLGQALYSSFDPGQATDAAQDALCSLTGTLRDPPSYSTAVVTCTGTPGTALPAGRVVNVANSNTPFASTVAATIAAVSPYVPGAVQAIGDRRWVGSSVYLCTTGGTNGGVLDGTQLGSDIHDGSAVRWTRLGAGSGAVDVLFVAQQVGALAASAGTLTQIGTPVFGWQGAFNIAAATPGALRESNTQLRVKREAELHSQGLAAADAIRQKVLAVGQGTSKYVTSCTVYFNDTDLTGLDSTGTTTLPPHSVLVLADYNEASDAALEQQISDAIWAAVGAGIATTSGTAGGAGGGIAKTGTVTDSQGNTQTVYWARPSNVTISVIANVTYDLTPGAFSLATGATDITNALVTYGSTYPAGKNVWASALVAAIFDGPTSTNPGATSVPGILDASVLIAVSPGTPGSTPLTMTVFQRATFDAAHITVNLTGASP